MKTQTSVPYLLPHPSAVVESPWTDERGVELAQHLDHWDPFSNLTFHRTLEIDLDLVRSSCQVRRDASFAICASWHSSRTRLGSIGSVAELATMDGRVQVPLRLEVPGSSSGGRLRLLTKLVLRNAGLGRSPLAPIRSGAVLWVHEFSLVLEGSSARFPINALDFGSQTHLPDLGAWMLEWEPDRLDGLVLADLRLLVNAADEGLISALRSGAADPRSSAIRSFVMFDTAKTLVHGALGNDDFVEDPERYAEGTVGRMLSELLELCWPGVPVATLATRARDEPARLDVELQAHLGLLR